jgi:hypothetical protein
VKGEFESDTNFQKNTVMNAEDTVMLARNQPYITNQVEPNSYLSVRFEVFTAVTMKNGVF